MRTVVLLLACAAGGACGGPDSEPTPLEGRWRQLPNALDPAPTAVADRRVLTFAAEGRLLDEEGPLRNAGSYEATATEVTTIDAGITTTQPYLVSADGSRLLLAALVRTGGAGATGAWDGAWTVDGTRHGLHLELRGDMTARTIVLVGGAPADDLQGTWTRSGDDLAVSAAGMTVPLYETLVDDRLGKPFERL